MELLLQTFLILRNFIQVGWLCGWNLHGWEEKEGSNLILKPLKRFLFGCMFAELFLLAKVKFVKLFPKE